MKKITFIFIFLFSCSLSFGQSGWTITTDTQVKNLDKVSRNSAPADYQLFHLDIDVFKQSLQGAPIRGSFSGRSKQIIYLPNAHGILEKFYVMETAIMEADLEKKFPMIKSYAAQGVDNPSAVARFSVTQLGVHSMTMTPGENSSYIDAYTENRENYIVYTKSSISDGGQSFECLMEDDIALPSLKNDVITAKAADDSKLRTYRLALSCTGEYGAIFAGTGTDQEKKANILAQMVVTMTRVNGVYERDLAITMVFVANNDLLLYYNPLTDPWNGEYNTKTAQTIDAAIGLANYDIGHNFNTSGGGNAGCIGCVCSTTTAANSGTHKGRGYTGRTNPTGDAFDIDYVAHEMGHQFGGFHTQSSRGCHSGNGTTEVEPGSGSTVMGYAGICAPNVQNNSDAYFHYVTIRDISNNVKNGISSSCAQISTFSNVAPKANAGRDYVIPKGTPFMLTGIGTDADGDILTYTWEQNDPMPYANSNYATPTATQLLGPVFRSIEGTLNPTRFFPAKQTVLAGLSGTTWEILPTVSRVMNFALTVRDNVAGGGQAATDEMKVTVSNVSGPFSVTSQNEVVTYEAGSNQTVTWNVALTDQAPVNARFVDIYLSTDNGATFSVLLASKVPNDGSELITVPSIPGTINRIMVKGYDSIFYDISNTSFVISPPTSSFDIAFSGTAGEQNKLVCKGGSLTYTIPFSVYAGFTAPVSFALLNVPEGITATLDTTSATFNTSIMLTVTSTAATSAQLYTFTIVATSGDFSKSVNLYADILENEFSLVSLTNPSNATSVLPTAISFNWTPSIGATAYDIEIATDAEFTTIVESATVLTNSYSVAILENLSNYYWRIKPKNEGCEGIFAEASEFSTIYCGSTPSENVPITIPTQVSTVTSILVIDPESSITINDLNVNVNLSHTYVEDISVKLTGPNGEVVQLFANKCGSNDNVNATFDDAGIPLVCGGSAAISGTFIPTQPLSIFNGQLSQGVWTLTVIDAYNGDGGTINSWGINFCSPEPPLDIAKNEVSDFVVYPNPNNGNFNVQFKNRAGNKIALNLYDISGRLIFQESYLNKVDFNENIQLNSVQTGVYLMTIFDGERSQAKRIIIK